MFSEVKDFLFLIGIYLPFIYNNRVLFLIYSDTTSG